MDIPQPRAVPQESHEHNDGWDQDNPVIAALLVPLNLLQLNQLGGGGTSTGLIVIHISDNITYTMLVKGFGPNKVH